MTAASVVCYLRLSVWLDGNALLSITAVTLHRGRLVLGWVAVSFIYSSGWVNHLGAEPGTQVKSAVVIPLWVGTMSTGTSRDTLARIRGLVV